LIYKAKIQKIKNKKNKENFIVCWRVVGAPWTLKVGALESQKPDIMTRTARLPAHRRSSRLVCRASNKRILGSRPAYLVIFRYINISLTIAKIGKGLSVSI